MGRGHAELQLGIDGEGLAGKVVGCLIRRWRACTVHVIMAWS